MTKKQRTMVIAMGAAIIILLILILIWEFRRDSKPQPLVQNQPENIYVPSNESAVTAPRDWEETEFRKAVPVDVKVPEVGESVPESLREIIAVPTHVVQSNQGSETDLRIFTIRGENNRFIPEQIIANYRDTVHIEFTAVDKDYDIVLLGYNMMQRAKMGETKAFEFQAIQEGRFLYFCESCGGAESSAKGEIIIVRQP